MADWKQKYRLVLLVFPLLFAGYAAHVNAEPDEDYKKGMAAWERGDFFAAVPAFEKAADAGHADSHAMLGSIHDAAEQDDLAVEHFRKAVVAGSLDGMFGLANMLAAGEGVAKDIGEARKLYERAAEAGHKNSIKVMAQIYMRGEMGVTATEQKSAEAWKWITSAAADGWLVALQAMESGYRLGEYGLAVDIAKADSIKQRITTIKGVEPKKGRRKGERK